MTRRYLPLAAAVVVLAVALTVLGRTRPVAGPVAEAPTAPVVELALLIRDGQVTPPAAAVAKGSRVRLSVTCDAAHLTRLTLTGYQDRLAIPPLAPGAAWTGEFIADRPGDDFAWLLDGEPAGRFSVTGSHLVEGHR